MHIARPFLLLLVALNAKSQDTGPARLKILTKELPPASMWSPYEPDHHYGFSLQAEGGVGPLHWRIVSGLLPDGVKLEEAGTITGTPQESGEFEFTVLLGDTSQSVRKSLTLIVETPLIADWDRKSQVSGQRIEGSVKVSNQTGRDFDLTFIVLAVNDIGRATAIGYQHFPLRKNTRDLQLPFGDTLSPGEYVVNVDVVAEEPNSKRIFRARLVGGKQAVTQGP